MIFRASRAQPEREENHEVNSEAHRDAEATFCLGFNPLPPLTLELDRVQAHHTLKNSEFLEKRVSIF